MIILYFVFLLIFSYFLGNIHFARILSKLKNDDITKKGSGNPGTINMIRNYGLALGVLNLVLDSLKGAIPALIGLYAFGGPNSELGILAMHFAGLVSMLGHIFPIMYGFKGGKGVATAFGFFTVVNPLISIVLFLIASAVFFITKLGSLGSLIYIASFFIYQVVTNFNLDSVITLSVILIASILVYVSHWTNIKRLANNEENKIDFKNPACKKSKENK